VVTHPASSLTQNRESSPAETSVLSTMLRCQLTERKGRFRRTRIETFPVQNGRKPTSKRKIVIARFTSQSQVHHDEQRRTVVGLVQRSSAAERSRLPATIIDTVQRFAFAANSRINDSISYTLFLEFNPPAIDTAYKLQYKARRLA